MPVKPFLVSCNDLISTIGDLCMSAHCSLSARVRGLRNVASYALYSLLCLVLNREAAENINRPDKAVSPTYFNT
jgi:hypothetical protein